MKKLFSMVTVAVTIIIPTGVGGAKSIKPTSTHIKQYKHLYHAVAHRFGMRAPGRNIIIWGTGNKPGHGPAATDADVTRSIKVLQRMMNPTPLTSPQGSTTSTQSVTTSSISTGSCGGVTPYSGGGQCWAIPYSIVSCESGGQNVPNSQGSGANGYYQLMSGGTGSRASQDAAAAQLWNGGAGASNWVCKG